MLCALEAASGSILRYKEFIIEAYAEQYPLFRISFCCI